MQPVRTPDGLYSMPIATLHCVKGILSQRLWQSGSHQFCQSRGACFNLRQTTQLHRWWRGWLIHLLHLSSPSGPPMRWDCQNCSRVLLTRWIFQLSPIPSSLNERALLKGGRERGGKEEVTATSRPPAITPPLKTQLGDGHRPVGGARGLEALTESKRKTISCWKQRGLISSLFALGTLWFATQEHVQNLSRNSPSMSESKAFDRPRPLGRFFLPAELSCGSVCAAVNLRWRAATWCGPTPLWASWAAADPSCRAAWTARCCDPGSTPWGTPGTKVQIEGKKRSELKWAKRDDRRCNVACERFVPQGPFQGTCGLYFSPNTWSFLPPAADTRSLSWDQTCVKQTDKIMKTGKRSEGSKIWHW